MTRATGVSSEYPDDPGDVASLDRPEWFKERLRLMQLRAEGGRKSVFGTSEVFVPEGLAPEITTGHTNGKDRLGELVPTQPGEAVSYWRQDTNEEKFSSRLRSLRLNRKLSIRELELVCGIHRATLHSLEVGRYEPRLGHLLALSQALKVSVAHLCGCNMAAA